MVILGGESNAEYQQLVQSYGFGEFQALQPFMESCREEIEYGSVDVLREVQQRFLPIVEEVLAKKGLFDSIRGKHGVLEVQPYTEPTVRGEGSTFAGYLHNDAWYESNSNIVGMVNIWFILNDSPPRNHLVFHSASKVTVSQTHILHGVYDNICGKTVVYDQKMSWGRFYCFVSGQATAADTVLLHGAMDVCPPNAADKTKTPERRRSCEMRFTIHDTERAEACPTHRTSSTTVDLQCAGELCFDQLQGLFGDE